MSSSVFLQFEEASQEAVLFAEVLKARVSAVNARTQEDSKDTTLAARMRDAWQWLNEPVSLSELAPKDPDGFMQRK